MGRLGWDALGSALCLCLTSMPRRFLFCAAWKLLLFRRLSRVELAGKLLHCAKNVELRSLVVRLFLAPFEIFFGSHIVGHITPSVQ